MLSIYARPVYDDREYQALLSYIGDLHNNWLGEHHYTAQLEKLICQTLDLPYCIATNTGTSALYAAYHGIGIKPDDEILVSAYTFVATIAPAKILGAEIRLVDIEPHTLGMCVESLKKSIGKKTKCVVLTPINGRHPDSINEIAEICRDRGIWLLEDCASAFGSKKFGKFLGTWGDVAITSFSTAKIVSAGQGGAVFTKHEDIAQRITKFKNFGRSESDDDIFDSVGLNFKLSDVNSVVASVQIRKLDETHKLKTKIFQRYIHNLGQDCFPATDFNEQKPTYVDFMATRGRREGLKNYLKTHSIGSRLLYPSLNQQPAFRDLVGDTPVAKQKCSDGLLLPSSIGLTENQVDFACEHIRDYLRR